MNVTITAMRKEHWDALMLDLPLVLADDTRGVVAVDDDDQLLAACVCEDWTVTAVTCHLMVKNRMALRHGFIEAVADFVFNQAGRIKILGTVPADNEAALKMNKHIGFTELIRIEDGYDWGIDYVLMELKRENCPYWTEVKDGQVITQAA